MNTFIRALMATTLLTVTSFSAFSREHGGGNGGDDLELELKKISLQIGYFVKSEMGVKIFKNLNPEAVIDTVNTLDIDVVSDKLTDKYGVERTCLNFPDRQLITCNINRVNQQKQDNILVGLLFHEILGLMEIELGHMENVSQYPISSKILPYTDIVLSTPIAEAQIRPEFFGLDSRSYGVTLVNKDTKETLRLICLNDNVEIHRCRNYSLVRQAQGLQKPLIPNVISLSPNDISSVPLERLAQRDIDQLRSEIQRIQKEGTQYLTFDFYNSNGNYVFGVGVCSYVLSVLSVEQCLATDVLLTTAILAATTSALPLLAIPFLLDIGAEVAKQAGNIIVFPFKKVNTYLKTYSSKQKLKAINKDIELAQNILNMKDDLSLVGTTQTVDSDKYNKIIGLLTSSILILKNKQNMAPALN